MNYVVSHLAEELGCSERDVERQLDGWDTHDYVVNGEVVGTAMVKGTEIHFALAANANKRSMLRGHMRSAIAPLLESMGFLTTRVIVGHEKQARFVERVGFEKTWSDGRFNYYLLANLPYERKAK